MLLKTIRLNTRMKREENMKHQNQRAEEMRDNIRRTLMTQDMKLRQLGLLTRQDIPGFQDSTPIFQPSAELIKQRLDQVGLEE